MIQVILALLMALISAVTAKKKAGANNAQAAAVGAVAGLGTYYVANETEWGKSAVSGLEGALGITDDKTTPTKQVEVVQPDGTKTMVTVVDDDAAVQATKDAEVVVKAADGSNTKVIVPSVVTPSKGTSTQTTMWDTLKSWGPTGTAAVVGTTAAVTSGDWKKFIPWAAGAFVLLMLLR